MKPSLLCKFYKGRVYDNFLFMKKVSGKLFTSKKRNISLQDICYDKYFDVFQTMEEFFIFHYEYCRVKTYYTKNMFMFPQMLYTKLFITLPSKQLTFLILRNVELYLIKPFFILESKLFLHDGKYLHLLKIMTGKHVFWISLSKETFDRMFEDVNNQHS